MRTGFGLEWGFPDFTNVLLLVGGSLESRPARAFRAGHTIIEGNGKVVALIQAAVKTGIET